MAAKKRGERSLGGRLGPAQLPTTKEFEDGFKKLDIIPATNGLGQPVEMCGTFQSGDPATTVESGDWKVNGIKDSGKRERFASGALRDPGEGKILWSRITHGPMMRRWAQHLSNALAKYPDPAPGVPNFTLIESDEEYIRYKESAFRHFMSWFLEEVDEDHAAATFFNINGVEIIKGKRKAKKDGETKQQ